MNSLPKNQNQPQIASGNQGQSNPSDIKSDTNGNLSYAGSTVSTSGLGTKEMAPQTVVSGNEELPLQEVGREIQLDRAIEKTGVKVTPTHMPLPKPIASSGVKPAGDNVTLGTGKSVKLPLTDDEISQGTKKILTASWKWLAEWCIRRIKVFQKNLAYKSVKMR